MVPRNSKISDVRIRRRSTSGSYSALAGQPKRRTREVFVDVSAVRGKASFQYTVGDFFRMQKQCIQKQKEM